MFKYFYFILTRFLLNLNISIHHKHINKNQITNLDLVIRSLKKREYSPKNIIDVGCYKGTWTKKLLKFYPSANFYLLMLILIIKNIYQFYPVKIKMLNIK